MNLRNLIARRKRGRNAASYRDHLALRECAPRMLRDIGLYREHGRLLPLHPQQEEAMDSSAPVTSPTPESSYP